MRQDIIWRLAECVPAQCRAGAYKRFRGLQGDEVRHGPSASRLAAHDADLKPHGSGDLDIVDPAPLGATLRIGAT
jgi:hypothetical protein